LRLPDHGREEIGILHRGREGAELVFLWFSIITPAVVISL
jgi:hypothetical protein